MWKRWIEKSCKQHMIICLRLLTKQAHLINPAIASFPDLLGLYMKRPR